MNPLVWSIVLAGVAAVLSGSLFVGLFVWVVAVVIFHNNLDA
jgi:hypothetical protein